MKTDRMFVNLMSLKCLVIPWLLLTISSQLIFSKPVQDSSKSRVARSTPVFDDVSAYLTKFGYLPELDLVSGNLRSEEQLKDALRTLQKFGNIPITGQFDNATKQLMRKPRCGVSDVTQNGQNRRKRFTLQGQKWNHLNLTWSLRTRRFARMDHGWVRADLHKALQVWSKHSKLTFQEVNNDFADILVFFEKGSHGDEYAFDGPGQVLAHAFFPGPGLGGDAHFDLEEDWLLNGKESNSGTSLFTTAAHEFGHSLGLSHSSVQGALMFPWYQGSKRDMDLNNDDRLGLQILYGSKDDRLWSNIPVYRPTSQRPDRPKFIPTTTTARTTTTTTSTSSTTTTSTTRKAFVTPPKRPDVRKSPAVDDKPDFCQSSIDAVSIIRQDTFFFKGKYTWRFGVKGLYPGYPASIGRLFFGLPDDMEKVDAVYERLDGKIVFFIGRRFYLFHGSVLESGYPKPLTALGLPEELDYVDAATVWGHNSKTYIFSGTMYWRYDDETEKMELDYPRDIMPIWKGVGYNINAAFKWHDGATYFFKNRYFWKFDDLRMRVEQEQPRSIGQFWFNCTADKGSAGDRNGRVLNTDHESSNSSSVTSILTTDHRLLLLLPVSLAIAFCRAR